MTPLVKAFESIDQSTGDNWQVNAQCKGLLAGYHHRWYEQQKQIRLVECESTYLAPLHNLETNRSSRTYQLGGKIDKIADDSGLVVFDHKTTSQDIADPHSPYWRQLVIEGQPSHYEILLLANGIRIKRAIWDVVRKPTIKPRQLRKREREEIAAGTYCGSSVSESARDLAAIDESREDAELFALRVASVTIGDPEKYFARRPVPRSREELADYNQELWAIGQDIRDSHRFGRHFRNPGACMNYGTPCHFLGICSNYDSPDSDRWSPKEQVHAELELSGDGRDVLTNSRIRCFQTCRRKHYYQYELGIEKRDAEEQQAFYFGNVFHSALDSWWIAVNDERQNDDITSTPAIDAVGGESDAAELAF